MDMEDNEKNNASHVSNDEDDEDNDRIDEMMRDVQEDFSEMPHEFKSLFDNAEKRLFPGSTKFTKLSGVLKLYNLKAKNGWSDKSFTGLLELLKDMLPGDNELPNSTYEAKKMLYPLSMDIEKIHACPNDCILYRRDYKDLNVCPKCAASRYKNKDACGNKKGPPAKVIWYLPVIPRFKRMFANPREATNLQWHAIGRKEDGKLRHPADSPQWRNIDRRWPDFGSENRNLRLGLCTDGMNPHGNMSSRHSTWPVLLVVYNLPPWLCMKRKYIMLSLLISRPKQPGNDIDVYLAPLIEDLKMLWNEGVPVYEAYSRSSFTLRAMIFCTINDFPAYGNLLGYTTKGAKACPICEDETPSLWLSNSRKNMFMSHRTFLPTDHPYRKKKKAFNGKSETKVARLPLSGHAIYESVKNVDANFGKTCKTSQMTPWKKRSIFWDLPYWKHLSVRHCLDVMHVEKNVCDSIIGTLLNIQGKMKDGVKARKDMIEMGIRDKLSPQESGKRMYLPPACHTLSKKEKTSFCACLNGVKVPSGYSSNIKKLVSMKDLKLVGMKSHDCHVLMQHMLPIAIRNILPKHVRQAITKLCFFFNAICSKVIDLDVLDDLQADVVVTLCQFEIYMGILKGYVRNRYRPEGSIIEGYGAEEVIDFCTDYLANVESIGVPRSRHEGRLTGKGTIGYKSFSPPLQLRDKAHHLVLQHLSEVHPYLDQHMSLIRQQNPLKGERWVAIEHNRTFITWFKDTVMKELSQVPNNVSETIKWLAYGLDFLVSCYEAYDINGYTFYTKRQDEKSVVQNSGVTQVALSKDYSSAKDTKPIDAAMSYYGVIEEIWELDYKVFKIPLFRCSWVDNRRGVRIDELGFTLVDFERLGYHDEPFILASQAKQVFYVSDPIDNKWSIVLQGKRSIVGVGDVVDEEEYDHFDETPPFSIGVQSLPLEEDNFEISYMRSDHEEGLWVDNRTS
ncbi:PREDICTED: uncharacterized protein LOC109183793 [Ipomoea nil]|uniref:uncharacterized protein LOC109183793 n=1 Tax=Ipomoea nil TaxID=35883 RepID=UPI0009016124|nr:PREDICTED: uncharacterized protein LOC109183793 [Ipomoea nil]